MAEHSRKPSAHEELASGELTFHSEPARVFDNSLFELGWRTLVKVFSQGPMPEPVLEFWLETNSEPTTEQIKTVIERMYTDVPKRNEDGGKPDGCAGTDNHQPADGDRAAELGQRDGGDQRL
jgi:hypothetical protein